MSANVISMCAHTTVRFTGPLWRETTARTVLKWIHTGEKPCTFAVWENLLLDFSNGVTLRESTQGQCQVFGMWEKLSRQWRMLAPCAVSGVGKKTQGCKLCQKDSGRWSHWSHLVSKASHFNQHMHPTDLIRQSMSPERQTSLPFTLIWCLSIENAQNNLRILKCSLELYKCMSYQ